GKRIHPTLRNPAKVKSRAYHVESLDSYKTAESWDITAPATDLAKKWDGWGTSLKPAHEPIIMVRKPLIDADTGCKLTVIGCVENYGTGAINIDACRIATEEVGSPLRVRDYKQTDYNVYKGSMNDSLKGGSRAVGVTSEVRFPANCITL